MSTLESGEVASTTAEASETAASEERSARKSKHKITSEEVDETSKNVEGRVSSKKARASEVMQSDAAESELPKKKKSKKEKVAVA